jgi:CRP/FNR family transcriptional regulator, cyclic AMP receptor protein
MDAEAMTKGDDATTSDPWAGSDLEALDGTARRALGAFAQPLEFGVGAEILREHRATPFLGLIEFGRVALRVPVPDRSPHTVVTLEPGDLIGWSAIVPPYRATADAVALTPTRIRAFEAEAVRELLATDPAIAAQVSALVLRCVSERLTTSWHQLLDLFGMRGVGPW